MIHACCGGTAVKQAEIVGNSGNSDIGIAGVPAIRDVRIVGNKLLSNVKGDRPVIYVNAGTDRKVKGMHNVRIENNIIAGSVLAAATRGETGNVIKNNSGLNGGSITYSCHVRVEKIRVLSDRPARIEFAGNLKKAPNKTTDISSNTNSLKCCYNTNPLFPNRIKFARAPLLLHDLPEVVLAPIQAPFGNSLASGVIGRMLVPRSSQICPDSKC